ncbi:hypothetical protein D3C74_353260 [compost metagenome]
MQTRQPHQDKEQHKPAHREILLLRRFILLRKRQCLRQYPETDDRIQRQSKHYCGQIGKNTRPEQPQEYGRFQNKQREHQPQQHSLEHPPVHGGRSGQRDGLINPGSLIA